MSCSEGDELVVEPPPASDADGEVNCWVHMVFGTVIVGIIVVLRGSESELNCFGNEECELSSRLILCFEVSGVLF